MKIVHDVTDYQLHFFSIPSAREPDKLRALCQFLNKAVAGFPRAAGQDAPYPIQLDLFRQRVSDRLAIVKPTRIESKHELELDVRTLHDAVFLRTRALWKGPLRLEDVRAHRSPAGLPQSDQELPNYPGALRVLYAETDEQGGSQRAEIGKQLAADGELPWIAEARPIVTELGAMLFGTPAPEPAQQPQAPALDLIFVSGRDAAALAERYSRHPFLLTVPELALCHLKVRNSAESLHATWLPKMAERDRGLHDLLPRRGEMIDALAQMRSRNDDITTRQADLVDALVHVRALLRTMRTNCDNFKAASSEQAFAVVAGELQQSLVDFWTHGTELQAANDIDYVEGTLNRAESHFKSIEATAAVYQARELGKISRLQILLAATSILIAGAALFFTWKSATSSRPPLDAGQATSTPAKSS